ncbi:hypothetical protein WJX72_009738 [[Myrmecia] bisecta]|uniref:Uncharacterized protein n=1 Tax=[Myrmecia] bisecta TaxID=41462 RepID=A0AAW1QCD2_9CHLO
MSLEDYGAFATMVMKVVKVSPFGAPDRTTSPDHRLVVPLPDHHCNVKFSAVLAPPDLLHRPKVYLQEDLNQLVGTPDAQYAIRAAVQAFTQLNTPGSGFPDLPGDPLQVAEKVAVLQMDQETGHTALLVVMDASQNEDLMPPEGFVTERLLPPGSEGNGIVMEPPPEGESPPFKGKKGKSSGGTRAKSGRTNLLQPETCANGLPVHQALPSLIGTSGNASPVASITPPTGSTRNPAIAESGRVFLARILGMQAVDEGAPQRAAEEGVVLPTKTVYLIWGETAQDVRVSPSVLLSYLLLTSRRDGALFLRMATGLGFCQIGDYVCSLFYVFRRKGHRLKCWECGVKKKAPCGQTERPDLPWCCHRRLGEWYPTLLVDPSEDGESLIFTNQEKLFLPLLPPKEAVDSEDPIRQQLTFQPRSADVVLLSEIVNKRPTHESPMLAKALMRLGPTCRMLWYSHPWITDQVAKAQIGDEVAARKMHMWLEKTAYCKVPRLHQDEIDKQLKTPFHELIDQLMPNIEGAPDLGGGSTSREPKPFNTKRKKPAASGSQPMDLQSSGDALPPQPQPGDPMQLPLLPAPGAEELPEQTNLGHDFQATNNLPRLPSLPLGQMVEVGQQLPAQGGEGEAAAPAQQGEPPPVSQPQLTPEQQQLMMAQYVAAQQAQQQAAQQAQQQAAQQAQQTPVQLTASGKPMKQKRKPTHNTGQGRRRLNARAALIAAGKGKGSRGSKRKNRSDDDNSDLEGIGSGEVTDPSQPADYDPDRSFRTDLALGAEPGLASSVSAPLDGAHHVMDPGQFNAAGAQPQYEAYVQGQFMDAQYQQQQQAAQLQQAAQQQQHYHADQYLADPYQGYQLAAGATEAQLREMMASGNSADMEKLLAMMSPEQLHTAAVAGLLSLVPPNIAQQVQAQVEAQAAAVAAAQAAAIAAGGGEGAGRGTALPLRPPLTPWDAAAKHLAATAHTVGAYSVGLPAPLLNLPAPMPLPVAPQPAAIKTRAKAAASTAGGKAPQGGVKVEEEAPGSAGSQRATKKGTRQRQGSAGSLPHDAEAAGGEQAMSLTALLQGGQPAPATRASGKGAKAAGPPGSGGRGKGAKGKAGGRRAAQQQQQQPATSADSQSGALHGGIARSHYDATVAEAAAEAEAAAAEAAAEAEASVPQAVSGLPGAQRAPELDAGSEQAAAPSAAQPEGAVTSAAEQAPAPAAEGQEGQQDTVMAEAPAEAEAAAENDAGEEDTERTVVSDGGERTPRSRASRSPSPASGRRAASPAAEGAAAGMPKRARTQSSRLRHSSTAADPAPQPGQPGGAKAAGKKGEDPGGMEQLFEAIEMEGSGKTQ